MTTKKQILQHFKRIPPTQSARARVWRRMGVMVRLHTTLLVTLLAAVLVTQGCSSARNRDEPGAMSLLSFRDSATADYLSGSYRTGSLYLDFRPALIVDAILEDARYQAHYLQSLGTHYMLPRTI